MESVGQANEPIALKVIEYAAYEKLEEQNSFMSTNACAKMAEKWRHDANAAEARLAESERERDQFKNQYQTKADLYSKTFAELQNLNALIAQEGRRPGFDVLKENTEMRIKLSTAEARVKELESDLDAATYDALGEDR